MRLARPCAGSLSHFFLKHQRHLPAPRASFQPINEEFGADIVRQIGNDHDRLVSRFDGLQIGPIDFTRILLMDPQPAILSFRPIEQRICKSCISFDTGERARTLIQNGARQAARARSDFNDIAVFDGASRQRRGSSHSKGCSLGLCRS